MFLRQVFHGDLFDLLIIGNLFIFILKDSLKLTYLDLYSIVLKISTFVRII